MVYKLKNHQLESNRRSQDKTAFALFHEQGTGKTGTLIVEACRLFVRGDINALVVVAPNGVHDNWITELPLFATSPYIAAAWRATPNKEHKKRIVEVFSNTEDILKVFTINVEAVSRGRGVVALRKFLSDNRAMLVIDEATRIKNPKAKRTNNVIDIGELASYRRIATGTPVTKTPLDLFAPMMFLDPAIIGCRNYFMFKAKYAVEQHIKLPPSRCPRTGRLIKRDFKKITGYKNIDSLMEKIKPWSYMVKKEDCLDLPEKIYQQRIIPLGKEQQRIYTTLRDKKLVEYNGEEQSVTNALTKMIRLQQVAGGFFVDDDGVTHPISDNKGVDEVVAMMDELRGGVIVWARFRAEITALSIALREELGVDAVVEYHGGTSQDDRIENIRKFQAGEAKVFLCTYCAATGITLNTARDVIYYSQSFDYEDRLQSEDRAHRIGTKFPVSYTTFVREGTIDVKINEAFAKKEGYASYVANAIRAGDTHMFK
jgi:SNF2 family DNA or RNA helicase